MPDLLGNGITNALLAGLSTRNDVSHGVLRRLLAPFVPILAPEVRQVSAS